MSAAVSHDPWLNWDNMLDTWRELDVPQGWRPELTDEGIRMSPPPGGQHNLIAATVHRTLLGVLPRGMEVFQSLGVGVPTSSAIFIPDVTVVHREDVPVDSTPIPAEKVLLATEITSPSNARDDRKKTKWCYAHGGVPLYLLIDPLAEDGPTVSLFERPADGAYGSLFTVPFGDRLPIPEPFDVQLDTSDF